MKQLGVLPIIACILGAGLTEATAADLSFVGRLEYSSEATIFAESSKEIIFWDIYLGRSVAKDQVMFRHDTSQESHSLMKLNGKLGDNRDWLENYSDVAINSLKLEIQNLTLASEKAIERARGQYLRFGAVDDNTSTGVRFDEAKHKLSLLELDLKSKISAIELKIVELEVLTRKKEREVRSLQSEISVLVKEIDSLEVRAPFGGVITGMSSRFLNASSARFSDSQYILTLTNLDSVSVKFDVLPTEIYSLLGEEPTMCEVEGPDITASCKIQIIDFDEVNNLYHVFALVNSDVIKDLAGITATVRITTSG